MPVLVSTETGGPDIKNSDRIGSWKKNNPGELDRILEEWTVVMYSTRTASQNPNNYEQEQLEQTN